MPPYSKAFLDSLERELNVAVLCDILDGLNMRRQAMDGRIYPLEEHYKLVGVARTMLAYDVYQPPAAAYETEIRAVDALREGDLMVCSAPSQSNGFWGELMTTAAIARGARGVIVDGAVRDIAQMKALGDRFRVFTAGRNPLDSKGRCLVADYDCPIVCGGVEVCPGDLIFGDVDGVVVIPKGLAQEVIRLAREKARGEDLVRRELRQGALLADAYAKYGIL